MKRTYNSKKTNKKKLVRTYNKSVEAAKIKEPEKVYKSERKKDKKYKS